MIARGLTVMGFVGAVILVSCRSQTSGSYSGGTGAASAGPAASHGEPDTLPGPCIDFLGRLRCLLRAAGNGPADVDRAVSDARASFEERPQAAEFCERAMVYRAELMASVGCANAGSDALPHGARAECVPGEHFFVRRDGHVSGCRRECVVAADCADGSSCVAVGSAAGGPIDEHFCE
jgi:hypothetical protein